MLRERGNKMNEHKGHKIGTILGRVGLANYCLDCSQVLEQLIQEEESR